VIHELSHELVSSSWKVAYCIVCTCLVRDIVESMLPEVMAVMRVKVVGTDLGIKKQYGGSRFRKLIYC
jgi:hypothetical protein